MKIAALTHVWNEADNLPIWISYYGKIFGKENLYVLDHGSDDGSTANLGPVNVVRFPHTPFDDNQKALAVSNLHRTLIQYFDCVLVSDCDEIIAPDPAKYLNLWQYIEKTQPTSVVCIGLHLQQILDRETSLALTRPILSQRQFAFFSTPSSKPLISSVPTRWLGGGHASSVCRLLTRICLSSIPNSWITHSPCGGTP